MRNLLLCFAALTTVALAADRQLGAPLTSTEVVAIAKLDESPKQFEGRTVQVRGKVSAVCEKAGCWMKLVDEASGKSVRVKVRDGEIVFPQEAVGKPATAEGKFVRAGENWQIQGTGAVIHE